MVNAFFLTVVGLPLASSLLLTPSHITTSSSSSSHSAGRAGASFRPSHVTTSSLQQQQLGSRVGGSRSALHAATMEVDVIDLTSNNKPTLEAEDEWIGKLDMNEFTKDFLGLGKELESAMGEADMKHLSKIRMMSNVAGAIGLCTMWMTPNPITVAALSTWVFSRWTMIGHHVCHGGYDKSDESNRFLSKKFALGQLANRAKNWFDWMLPEAWNIEHNARHHYFLGEKDDPDMVEHNSAGLKELPVAVRYMLVAALAVSWKWFYYAPNTYKELKVGELRRANNGELPEGLDQQKQFMLLDLLVDRERMHTIGFSAREFMFRVMGPYLIGNFILRPLPFLLFGKRFFFNAMINLVLADVVTNLHGFLMIVTNHAGADLYKFSNQSRSKGTFFLRQIISSANYRTGGDWNDFTHGFLNYQVEHHLWPNLSMLQYQRAQPRVKALCEKHGVPYIQESVWIRLKKTVDIMVGKATQRQFPEAYEVLA